MTDTQLVLALGSRKKTDFLNVVSIDAAIGATFCTIGKMCSVVWRHYSDNSAYCFGNDTFELKSHFPRLLTSGSDTFMTLQVTYVVVHLYGCPNHRRRPLRMISSNRSVAVLFPHSRCVPASMQDPTEHPRL